MLLLFIGEFYVRFLLLNMLFLRLLFSNLRSVVVAIFLLVFVNLLCINILIVFIYFNN